MRVFAKLLAIAALAFGLNVQADTVKAGIVVMHGKGGSPGKHVADLAASLERHGFVVANLEMPWSGSRNYDVDVGTAEREVAAALAALRERGASRVFVAGHSQGGLFALYFGGRHRIDGIVAIAPGGNVGNQTFREKLADSVESARELVAAGKGQEKARLSDFESARGTYSIVTTPSIYLTWFDPEGAMNQTLAMQGIKADTPVLFIVPTNDYPGLLRVKQEMFGLLAKHPLTRLYEPNSSHLNAPTASIQEIADWLGTVAKP